MKIHIVKSGDTLYNLAESYHTTTKELQEINAITDPNHLVIGQALIVPEKNTPYTIYAGQTLADIAKRNNIPLFFLLSVNPHIGNSGMVLPGQIVYLPGGADKKEIIVNGYTYPTTSTEILESAYPGLTYLSIFSYQAKPDGSLIAIDDNTQITSAITNNVEPKMVITNIEEGGSFSSDIAHEILQSLAIQETLLGNAIEIMDEKGYVGLDIDFEYLYPEDENLYNQFLEYASSMLHILGYSLSTAVAPKTSADQAGLLYEAHNYVAHGKYTDEVILMTYEWGYLYGPPMAVSPLDKVRQVLEYAVTEIPPEKILMGIPNYGYDWTLPYVEGSAAKTISNLQAIDLAIAYGAEIQFDEISATPYFTYYDDQSREHIVWFEDARSILAKLELVKELNLGGVSYWTVNNAFPQNWYLITSLFHIKKGTSA